MEPKENVAAVHYGPSYLMFLMKLGGVNKLADAMSSANRCYAKHCAGSLPS